MHKVEKALETNVPEEELFAALYEKHGLGPDGEPKVKPAPPQQTTPPEAQRPRLGDVDTSIRSMTSAVERLREKFGDGPGEHEEQRAEAATDKTEPAKTEPAKTETARPIPSSQSTAKPKVPLVDRSKIPPAPCDRVVVLPAAPPPTQSLTVGALDVGARMNIPGGDPEVLRRSSQADVEKFISALREDVESFGVTLGAQTTKLGQLSQGAFDADVVFSFSNIGSRRAALGRMKTNLVIPISAARLAYGDMRGKACDLQAALLSEVTALDEPPAGDTHLSATLASSKEVLRAVAAPIPLLQSKPATTIEATKSENLLSERERNVESAWRDISVREAELLAREGADSSALEPSPQQEFRKKLHELRQQTDVLRLRETHLCERERRCAKAQQEAEEAVTNAQRMLREIASREAMLSEREGLLATKEKQFAEAEQKRNTSRTSFGDGLRALKASADSNQGKTDFNQELEAYCLKLEETLQQQQQQQQRPGTVEALNQRLQHIIEREKQLESSEQNLREMMEKYTQQCRKAEESLDKRREEMAKQEKMIAMRLVELRVLEDAKGSRSELSQQAAIRSSLPQDASRALADSVLSPYSSNQAKPSVSEALAPSSSPRPDLTQTPTSFLARDSPPRFVGTSGSSFKARSRTTRDEEIAALLQRVREREERLRNSGVTKSRLQS